MAPENPPSWPQRYRALLAGSQMDATDILDTASQRPTADRPILFSLAQLLESPELLRQQVAADYPDVADQGPVTRLSVLQLDLMTRIIAPLILQFFRDGCASPPDASTIFLMVRDSKTDKASRWCQVPEQSPQGAAVFIEATAQQLQLWYRVFRQSLGVSPGAYWSSAAIALGAPFSAVWNRVNAQELCTLAEDWLAVLECPARQYVDWLAVGHGLGQVAIPQRRGCCLKYRLPDGRCCGTCGLHRKERLAALRQQTD